MNDYDALRQETLSLLAGIMDTAKRTGAAETERRLHAARTALAESVLLTVVCGEFKRGKSSLLNALLDEKDLLPVEDYFATSLVTTVCYGPAERLTVHLAPAGGTPQERQISRGELAGYVTEGGNPGNTKGVTGVTVEIPSPRLASGLTFVDTPGVGGVHTEHSAAATAALPGAHAIIFVTDVTQPLTKTELHFLRRAAETADVLSERDALLFVLTKIDMVADFTDIMANTRRKLAEVTGWPEDQVTVIPVSSQAKLDYLESGDGVSLEMSNFAALEDHLWGALTRRRAKAILGRALTDIELSTLALLGPIEEQIDLLNARTAEKAEELRDAHTARQRRLDELKAGDAVWRRDLAAAIAKIARDVRIKAADSVDEVWHRLRVEYLNDDELLRNTDGLVNRLVDDMVLVVGTANRLLGEQAAVLQREFAARNQLDLGHAEIGRLPAPPVSDIRVTSQLGAAERPSNVLRNWRDISTGSTAGGMLGGIAGGLIGQILIPVPGAGAVVGASIGGALGGVIGGAFGLRVSAKAVAQQDREARRRSLQLTLEPFYREQRRHIETAVSDIADEFTTAITAELDSRIAQERDSVNESARRAKEASKLGAAEVRQALADLAAERGPLDRARRDVTWLAQRAATLAERRNTGPAGDTPAAGQASGGAGPAAGNAEAPGAGAAGAERAGTGPAMAEPAGARPHGTDGTWADE